MIKIRRIRIRRLKIRTNKKEAVTRKGGSGCCV